MINLAKVNNNTADTLEVCKKLIKFAIGRGTIKCSQLCEHYPLMNTKKSILCPSIIAGYNLDICVEEVIKSVKKNPRSLELLSVAP